MADPLSIDLQPTPNINAMKFVVNRRLTEGKSRTFRGPEEAADSPLAKALLSIPGVVQVFFLNDFVTITRDPKSDWDEIVGKAEDVVRTHFQGS